MNKDDCIGIDASFHKQVYKAVRGSDIACGELGRMGSSGISAVDRWAHQPFKKFTYRFRRAFPLNVPITLPMD